MYCPKCYKMMKENFNKEAKDCIKVIRKCSCGYCNFEYVNIKLNKFI